MAPEYFAVGFTILVTVATSAPLGAYMFRVFTGQRTSLDVILGPIERRILRLTGVDSEGRQDWRQYSTSLLVSNLCMWLATWMIFNAVIIIALIPLALRGISYKPPSAAAILRRHLLIYGAGGVVLPFIGIKAIDIVPTTVGLA